VHEMKQSLINTGVISPVKLQCIQTTEEKICEKDES